MGTISDPRTAQQGSVVDAFHRAIGGLPRTAAELVGSLGWLEYRALLIAQLVWVVGLAAAAGRPWRHTNRRLRTAAAMWAVLLVATPVVFEVVFFESIGPIWQGRYSIPLWLGGAALVVISRHERCEPNHRHITRAVLPLLVTVEVLTFWTVLRRSTVGTDGSWWLTDAVRVGAPEHPRALLVAHLALATLLAAMVQRDRALTTGISASQ